MAAMVNRTCGVCQKQFEVPKCRADMGGGKYCSVRCRQRGAKMLRDAAGTRQDKRERFRADEKHTGRGPRW